MGPDKKNQPHLAEVHLQRALLSARVLLPMCFMLGFVGGTSIRLWPSNKVSALLALSFPLAVAIWLMLVYHRTDGIMHDPSLAKPSPEPE